MADQTIVKPDQEVKPDVDTPKVCQVKIIIRIAHWLKWPSWSIKCNRRATWSSISLCCGETWFVCDRHEEMAQTVMKHQQIRCTKCGSINAQMLWSRLR